MPTALTAAPANSRPATDAHKMLAGGMNETDLTTLAGWRSRTMVSRYAASAATERATEVGKRLSPGDKL
jgi:hypothetical protein